MLEGLDLEGLHRQKQQCQVPLGTSLCSHPAALHQAWTKCMSLAEYMLAKMKTLMAPGATKASRQQKVCCTSLTLSLPLPAMVPVAFCTTQAMCAAAVLDSLMHP